MCGERRRISIASVKAQAEAEGVAGGVPERGGGGWGEPGRDWGEPAGSCLALVRGICCAGPRNLLFACVVGQFASARQSRAS